MRKKYLLLCLMAAFLAAACSKPVQEVPEEETIEIKSAAQIEKLLSDTGWETQTTTAASFHLWEQLSPVSLILAENRTDECLVIGEFSSEEDAQKAYASLVPTGKDASVSQDTEDYQQALVTLENDEGCWLFRQIGNDVFGGCADTSSEAAAFASLFNSFQVGAASSTTPQIGTDDAANTSSTSKEDDSSANTTTAEDNDQ